MYQGAGSFKTFSTRISILKGKMASSQIPLPKKLHSRKPRNGSVGSKDSKVILDEKDDKVQVNTLVYAIGGNANDILKSFHLAERATVYATVKRHF